MRYLIKLTNNPQRIRTSFAPGEPPVSLSGQQRLGRDPASHIGGFLHIIGWPEEDTNQWGDPRYMSLNPALIESVTDLDL
jgi:hypothetical protein